MAVTPEIFGHIGGLLVAVSLIPQVIKSWKTKSTTDISIIWTSLMAAGLVFWIIYGYHIMSVPLLVFSTIELALTVSVLMLKLRYK